MGHLRHKGLRKLLLALGALLVLSACQQKLSILRPPSEDEGAVYLYLMPMPQESDKLTFTLKGLTAVKEDGTEIPLQLARDEFKGAKMKSQSLLASGGLVPGQYIGFSVTAEKASIAGESGESSLLVPDQPVKIPFPFTVIKSRSLMLDMSFDYAGSVGNAISFSPYFKVFLPEKIVTNLIGCSTNTGSDNINVFNKFTREVVGVITMGHDPAGMALDQNLRRLYVAASGSDEIEVIDLETGEFLNRIRLNNGDTPQEIGLTPDGGTLLVTNRGSGTVSFINTNTFLETNRIKVGDGPTTLLMDRTGTRAYVFNNISNSISVIQISNQAVAGTIPSESSPIRGQLNAAGTALYFIQANSPYLTVVNLPALSVANRVYIGLGLLSIKVDPATNYIFISKRDEDRLFVYDPFSFIPIDYILTDGDVTYMAIDGENNNLFLLIPEKKTIQVINLNSRRTLSDVGVLEDPYYVTMMGERF